MRRAWPLLILLALACDDAPSGGDSDGAVVTADADLDAELTGDVAVTDMANVDPDLPDLGGGEGDLRDMGAPGDQAVDVGRDASVDGGGVDAGPVATPCAPCEGDDDCPAGLCLEVGLRHFCGGDCADDDDCDDGFECVDLDPDDEEDVAQCRSLGGLCPACADDDTTCNGIDDDCDGTVDEDYAGGACLDSCAETSCVDGEPIGCPEPPADLCNDADDDCDGAIDEDYVAGDRCGVGACERDEACVEGEAVCAPGEASATDATCDGVDDDCDGTQDEDFATDDTCGDGVCRRDAACVDGELVCAPGEALAPTDETCDGVDDDCDGAVDDECQRNVLSFELAESGDGFVDVHVVYDQDHSPLNDGHFWRPRAVDMRVVAPAGLSLRLPNNEGVLPGPATIEAEKRVNVNRPSPTETRVTIIAAGNDNRIAPGVLVTLRFTHEGAAPPFAFGWNVERTNLAPAEARDVLEVEEAQLE